MTPTSAENRPRQIADGPGSLVGQTHAPPTSGALVPWRPGGRMRSGARGLAGLTLAVTVWLPTGVMRADAATEVTCDGLTATIVGTTGDDVLVGTAGADVIAGLDGHDSIRGGGGDDVVCGDEGGDSLAGGPGDDRVLGGPDGLVVGGMTNDGGIYYFVVGDKVQGGSGDDWLDLGYDSGRLPFYRYGLDVLRLDGARGTTLRLAPEGMVGTATGHGHDRVVGHPKLKVVGSAGPDDLQGTAYNDLIDGGGGDDVLRGLAGSDRLRDGDVPDTFSADRLLGGEGADKLDAAGGRDEVAGGRGADTLSIGRGGTIHAGPGDDWLHYERAGTGCVRMLGEAGKDVLFLHPALTMRNAVILVDLDQGPLGDCGTLGGTEVLNIYPEENTAPTWWVRGTPGRDLVDARSLIRGSGRVVAHLGGGGDVARTGSGDDRLWGGPGTDWAYAGGGQDRCRDFERVDRCEDH